MNYEFSLNFFKFLDKKVTILDKKVIIFNDLLEYFAISVWNTL